MMTSAIRAYVNRFAVTPGERIAIFTNNDDGRRTAGDLVAAGIDVATIIDSRKELPPEVKEKCPTARVVAAGEVIATSGRPLPRALTVRIPPGSEVIEADVLGYRAAGIPRSALGVHGSLMKKGAYVGSQVNLPPNIAMRGDGLTSWKICHFGTRSRLPTEDFFGHHGTCFPSLQTRDMKAKKPINYVRSFRLRCGLSQGELADLLGWNRPDVISRVEKKQRAPSLRFVIACFILFGASAAELFPDTAAGVEKTIMARVWEMYESIQGNPSRKTKMKIALLESAIERAQKRGSAPCPDYE